jgi:hypothetical protein
MATVMPQYPVHIDFEGDTHIARWRPLVHWLLAIPHFVVMALLGWLQGLLTLVSFFTILFTGAIPRSLFDVMVMTYRYQWRLTSYVLFLREDYPPFDVRPDAFDHTVDHARLSVEYPQHLTRWMPLVKWFLALPHVVLLALLTPIVVVVLVANFIAVLVTGDYPRELRDFVVGYYRWSLRLSAYTGLLTDQYPPFSISR